MSNINIINSESVSWMKEQPSAIYDLIIADPPYNVGKDYDIISDKMSKESYLDFLNSWMLEASRLLKPNGTIYIFMGYKYISYVYSILEEKCGLYFNTWICWHYTQGMGRKKGFSSRHDDILMFTKHKNDYKFNLNDIRVPQKYYRSINNMRGANPGDVWEFSHIHYCQENRQQHPSQKPEGLIERMVLASSSVGDNILDPFCGSGTTLRVCQQLNRSCIGVEINKTYVDMVIKRLSQPFFSFDSIDPRMKRVPLNLPNNEIREKYIKDHKKWFLKHHEQDVKDFENEISKIYGKNNDKSFNMSLF